SGSSSRSAPTWLPAHPPWATGARARSRPPTTSGRSSRTLRFRLFCVRNEVLAGIDPVPTAPASIYMVLAAVNRIDAPSAPDPRVAAAVAGDRRAAESLLAELLPRVRNLVRCLMRGDSLVDDVAQEALIAILRGLPTYRGEGSLKSWSDRVVARTTFAAIR